MVEESYTSLKREEVAFLNYSVEEKLDSSDLIGKSFTLAFLLVNYPVPGAVVELVQSDCDMPISLQYPRLGRKHPWPELSPKLC